MKRIPGIKIVFDKTPQVWYGSVQLYSNYLELSEYVTSSEEDLKDAITDILKRYEHKAVKGLQLKRIEKEE